VSKPHLPSINTLDKYVFYIVFLKIESGLSTTGPLDVGKLSLQIFGIWLAHNILGHM
jgi:hypothetical protein